MPPSPSPVLVPSRCPESRSRWFTKTAPAAAQTKAVIWWSPGLGRDSSARYGGDPERYSKTYFGDIKVGGRPVYFTGDGARFDEDGYLWVMGRVDDVLNVAGHRIGTAEVESALVSHPHVAEAAVVGRPDELKGQAIVAFVTLRSGHSQTPETAALLKDQVVREIGAIARPDDIRFTDALPKTRSGKIMRRLLREIATTGKAVGDVTTLEDIAVLQRLSASDSDEE